MKPLQTGLVLGAGILVGTAAGWTLRGSQKESPTQATTVVEHRESRAPTKQSRPEPSAQVRSVLANLRNKPGSVPRNELEHCSVEELQAIAMEILKDADPIEGLDGPLHNVFEAVLQKMGRKDRDATFAWIDATFPKHRSKLCSTVIEDTMPKATNREKLELFKSRNMESSEVSNYAGRLMIGNGTEVAGLDTEQALYLFKHVEANNGGSSGGTCNFAPGFDFAKFAQATLEQTRANGNERPAYYPSNFLEEWARVSPQDAIDFFFKNCTGKNAIQLPFNEVDEILKGVKTSVTPQEYAAWLGQTISQQSMEQNSDGRAMVKTMLQQELSDPALMNAVLGQVRDPSIRDEIMWDMLNMGAQSSSYNGAMQLRNALLLYPDPAARMQQAEKLVTMLHQRRGDENDSAKQIENLCQQLSSLGHSDADIQRVRAAK